MFQYGTIPYAPFTEPTFFENSLSNRGVYVEFDLEPSVVIEPDAQCSQYCAAGELCRIGDSPTSDCDFALFCTDAAGNEYVRLDNIPTLQPSSGGQACHIVVNDGFSRGLSFNKYIMIGVQCARDPCNSQLFEAIDDAIYAYDENTLQALIEGGFTACSISCPEGINVPREVRSNPGSSSLLRFDVLEKRIDDEETLLYPNPLSLSQGQKLSLRHSGYIRNVKLFSVTGAIVPIAGIDQDERDTQISIERAVPPGIYFLIWTEANGVIKRKKLIIN